MIDPAGKIEWACPLNGQLCVDGSRADFPKDRVGNLVKCRWWQHVAGKDPQSEKVVDQADCAVAWLPTIGIENSQMSRQTAASVDKVANQVSEVKLGLTALSGAVRVAGASIAQAVDAGALTVVLPSPNEKPEPNGDTP
jgi:hypothetical protein